MHSWPQVLMHTALVLAMLLILQPAVAQSVDRGGGSSARDQGQAVSQLDPAGARTYARDDTTETGGWTGENMHPNRSPYRSDRSFGRHLLAVPSYVVFGVTRPLGWGVKYLEREFPALFEPQLPVRGVLPLVELGGPVGVQGGFALFDHDLFGIGHDAQLSAIYGSRSRYEIDLDYGFREAFGPRVDLAINAELFTNPERRFFLDGNDARPSDETRYFIRQLSSRARLGLNPSSWSSGGVDLVYSRTQTKPADGVLGGRLPPDLPGLNRVIQLLTLETTWRLGNPRQLRQRTVSGTRLVVDGRYSHDLNSADFRHVFYGLEVQQYVPLGILPPTRRLALRARVEKVEPVWGGASVPFFRFPGAGGQNTVRSLVFERFVQEGALIVNAEYNYPIWNLMDAVVFADAGQVFNEFEEIAPDRFRYSHGGGIRVIRGGKLAFRFEVAVGEGNVRTILTVNQFL